MILILRLIKENISESLERQVVASTLIDVIIGLLPPSKGDILIDEVSLKKGIITLIGQQKLHMFHKVFI